MENTSASTEGCRGREPASLMLRVIRSIVGDNDFGNAVGDSGGVGAQSIGWDIFGVNVISFASTPLVPLLLTAETEELVV